MKKIVISLGGSVLISEYENKTFIQNFTKLMKKTSENYKIYLVIGGGKTARNYIKVGRTLNLSEKKLDEIGIEITRVNASFLASILKFSNTKIPHTTNEAKNMKNPVVIMGGTTPGHSTDMVAAELAEKTKSAKLIIATNVDGIYDKDPNKYKNAKQIKEISVKKLIDQYGTEWESAGKNVVIDGPALKIIQRLKIPTFVLNGKKLDQLEKAIDNNSFNGTKIKI